MKLESGCCKGYKSSCLLVLRGINEHEEEGLHCESLGQVVAVHLEVAFLALVKLQAPCREQLSYITLRKIVLPSIMRVGKSRKRRAIAGFAMLK